MGLNAFVWTFLGFITLVALVDALYLSTTVVNVSLPTLGKVSRPLPPLVRLRALPERKAPGALQDVVYAIASETAPGCFLLDGDKVRLNEDFLRSEITGSENVSESVTVTVFSPGTQDLANATVNLLLTGDQLDCEKSKRRLCFWEGASFRVGEAEGSVVLGSLSSDIFAKFCKNYVVDYDIVKGENYLVMKKTKEKSWLLSTTKKIRGLDSRQIRFAVNCTVTSEGNTESFLQDFNLTVVGKEKLQIFVEANYRVPSSNIIFQNETVSTWIINDPRGRKLNLRASFVNDTKNNFGLRCSQGRNVAELSQEASYYECEVTAKKTIYLDSPYTAVVQIEDVSSPLGQPDRFYFQKISLQPVQSESKPEKSSGLLSMNEEESFMLSLKYPEFREISRKSVLGTRVAEPLLLPAVTGPTDVRKRVASSKIQFYMLTPGAFNVTKTGGIIYVSNRHMIKEMSYRLKIAGVHPNGYKFFSTVQVNVSDAKSSPEGPEVCEKNINESVRPSCSEKRSKTECLKTCGVSSGTLQSVDGYGAFTTAGCFWRSNENPQKLSKMYETCSPDLLTCPDRFCDSLEAMIPKICPQDCTEYVFGSANKENHSPGIASATGVCTCDTRQKCLCSMISSTESVAKQSERRKLKQTINDTVITRREEIITAMKATHTDNCGPICFLSIIGGGFILVGGTFAILLMIYRRKVKKRCLNQGPLKEDMVNINYEEYVERPGDLMRPLTQTVAIKEIPEYYDKKWEFPRYRLTIEETIGEGEFGKVLKARADGINGNAGSTTVAVKTLKDNAKDSELADLISEYQLLKEIDHPNVIHLLGACTKLDGPVYIIIEYAKHGSLRNYLRKHRYVSYEEIAGKEDLLMPSQTVTPKEILTFAWQIAKGMNYLTDMKLVHRDLAARNVLVAEGLICKISDFGLTRDIYEDDTYLKRSKGRVPVKWMALESLADHIYTTKSDVWSYGVVLWELVTTGSSPYPGIAGQNLFHLLKSGYRMEKPPNCSPELYQILRSCWQENPSHRPTFKSLVAKFEEMLGEGKDYLDLNPRTIENKTYFSEFLNDLDETEGFLSDKGRATDEQRGIFKVKFEMFERVEECNKCHGGKCTCQPKMRYENEKVMLKPKYENDGMEDTGYVQPTGHPKPV